MRMLTAASVMEQAMANVHEWLAPWFDGAAHTVGGETRVFPRARWAFNEAPARQPQWTWGEAEPQVEIRVIPTPEGTYRYGENEGTRHQSRQRLAFWITAQHPEAGVSAEAAQAAASCLAAMLTAPEYSDAIQVHGLSHWQVELPVAVPTMLGAGRLVLARVTLDWWVPSV